MQSAQLINIITHSFMNVCVSTSTSVCAQNTVLCVSIYTPTYIAWPCCLM